MNQMIADIHSELAVREASKRDKPLEVLDALPSHPRIKSVADIMQPPAPRCVRFSDRRQIFVFEDNGDCRKSRWYLYAEKKRFESEAARDARRTEEALLSAASDAAAAGPSGDILLSEETLCQCVGIEKLMTPHRARRTREHKRSHAQVLISLQDMCSAEQLCRISQESSRSRRKTAQELAIMYWDNLKVC